MTIWNLYLLFPHIHKSLYNLLFSLQNHEKTIFKTEDKIKPWNRHNNGVSCHLYSHIILYLCY